MADFFFTGLYPRWADYPSRTPVLRQSLRESGKSRADLWALAATTAVEWGIATTNMRCRHQEDDHNRGGCAQRDGEDDCQVEPGRAFVFRTGRRDCIWEEGDEDRPYWHDVEEVHPNPHGSGRITMDFFREQFGLNSREVIGIIETIVVVETIEIMSLSVERL